MGLPAALPHAPLAKMPMKQLAALGGVRAALRICTAPTTGPTGPRRLARPELPINPVSDAVTWNSAPTVAVLIRAWSARPPEKAIVGASMSTPNSRFDEPVATAAPTGGERHAVVPARSPDSLPRRSVAVATAQSE